MAAYAEGLNILRHAKVGKQSGRIVDAEPEPVVHGRPLLEPHNLGGEWVGFNFGEAFGRPVKVMNGQVEWND